MTNKPYKSLSPLLPWREMARPLAWEAIFGRPAPLELEIGFGNGERLARRAEQRPELNLVGLDVSWPSARRCLRKIDVNGLANLRLLLGPAEVLLDLLFASRALAGVEALFPCPWPAARHAHRRLFDSRFWRLLNNRLEDGAVCHLVSDHQAFVRWLLEQVPQPGFAVDYHLCGPGQETKYERKWLRNGQQRFHEVLLAKTAHLPWTGSEETVLQFPSLPQCEPRDFPLGDHPGPPRISFKEMIFDPELKRGMLLTVVVESDLRQAFWMEFSWQPEKNHWRLRPAPGCYVIPTKGVQQSLELASTLAMTTQSP